MTKTPPEKIPPAFDQDIVQRTVEDIYKNLGNIESKAQEQLAQLASSMRQIGDSVDGVKTSLGQNVAGQQAPIPVPTNLTIVKVPLVPIVVMWCDPIEVIKYPYIGGFQFFASPEENFTPLSISGIVTYSGTCTVSSGGNNLVDTSNVTKSTIPLFGSKYTGIPFWPDMRLALDSINITNVTDDSSGTVTAWSNATPWQITCPLAGGAANVWASGDVYRFTLNRNKNIIGQGPLPFAVSIIPLTTTIASQWDRFSYYGKARMYGRGLPRHRKEGQVACASTTGFGDQELTAPTAISAAASEENYFFQISWTAGHDSPDGFAGYRLYRTTANNTALLTDDTYLIADNVLTNKWTDYGYDALDYPNGPCAGATYWYWVRVADTGGYQSDFDTPDSDALTIPNAPTFLSGSAAESSGYGHLHSWLVKWKAVGGALGYNIKYAIQGGDYTPVTYVDHTTAFGQDAGDDIQQFTFDGLEANRTYTFSIQSVNNLTVTALQSAFTDQNYTIQNANTPLPPF